VTAAFRTGQFKQAGTHGLGGARQQFTKKPQRNVEAKPDFFGQPSVTFGECRTRVSKPRAEKWAPEFSASEWKTSWLPRCSKTSVTTVPICERAEIASRCACVFVLAISIRSLSLRRAEAVKIGSATTMSSSRASRRTTSMGAL
jgi:hypothetical protein